MFPLRRRQYSCTPKVVEFTNLQIYRFTNNKSALAISARALKQLKIMKHTQTYLFNL